MENLYNLKMVRLSVNAHLTKVGTIKHLVVNHKLFKQKNKKC
jgi:hypothetical protein